jgi:glycolate oxidase
VALARTGRGDHIATQLAAIVGADGVTTGAAIAEEDTHDEALTASAVRPLAVVRPTSTEQVRELVVLAAREGIPLVARGSGTGLSGGCRPEPDSVVVAFDRMDRIVDIDRPNQVAVVQPGVTLAALDAALAGSGLLYPVYPGEMSASLGGNVATNAGGMRAVRYGVTRQHVLGLEAVLGTGEIVRTGGRFVKSSSGYDLTQLIVGSEGTLALVTEVTVKLVPRLPYSTTLLAPFGDLDALAGAVPTVVTSGVAPLILEYIDATAMTGIAAAMDLELGVPDEVRATAAAYLVVVLEATREDGLEADVATVAAVLTASGAAEVYVLPALAGAALISARERAFFVAKAAGADDIVDAVVPRGAVFDFMAEAARLATRWGAFASACGHVGDGNVHLSIFQPDPAARHELMAAIVGTALDLGGAVSGEHGIGTEKLEYFLATEDPVKLELMRRIKAAFDPDGVLAPGRLLDRGPSH